MALSSQVANVGSISGSSFTGIIHEMYQGEVKKAVRASSITSQLFKDAGPGEYSIIGEKLVFPVDLKFPTGAMHTSGYLPDHMYQDAVEGQVTPTRAYRRGAIDNYEQRRGVKSPASFEDLLSRLFDQVFDSFKRLEIRAAIGGSSGYLALTSARTSNQIIVMKDGYGHTGTAPSMHMAEGQTLAWLDATNSYAVGGSGKISSIAYDTSATTTTVTFAASIENGSGTPTIAAGDPWVNCTTSPYTVDYFSTEYNVSRNGLADIVDPDNSLTTIHGISEATYARWRPWRQASSTFDHIELTEHWQQLAAQSTDLVNAQTHVALTSGAVVAELARTLEGFQQQQNLGRTFEGGYQAVKVAGMDIVPDPYFYHDVLITLCLENLIRVSLETDGPEYFEEDGSMFSRLADFDGKEWYVYDYTQMFTNLRNRHAALTGITISNVTAANFSAMPRASA